MNPYIVDWTALVVRWIHIITGVTWIGTSFYFNWLNNNLRPPEVDREDGVESELWSVHGGAFYAVHKYAVAPANLPKHLHWFKWEAYFTWITGTLLLGLVYYMGADAFLVGTTSKWVAMGIGAGTLVGGWIVYDLLCKTLGKQPLVLSIIGFILFGAIAYGLTSVLNPRGAYIHMGAMIGTIMAANVFFVIIPNQRIMVDSMLAGEAPDGSLGKAGALRSLHNNYLTLPVLFIMVSNHYPMTFGHTYNWAILIALTVIGGVTRHYFNLAGKGRKAPFILPAMALAVFALAFVTRPAPRPEVPKAAEASPSTPKVAFSIVRAIIDTRCLTCHAKTTTHPTFQVAQAGVMFDTPEQIKSKADKIRAQAVINKIMPLGNLTGMTDEERVLLGRWIDEGASIAGAE